MLDQRGTGRSTPVSADLDFGPLAGLTPSAQAEYLTHLRADEIVRDAEACVLTWEGSPGHCWGSPLGDLLPYVISALIRKVCLELS
ncbi:hypothetical protein [Mobiluncus curtisii]|uniref:hypothetical protein n=1 Tax=Mobiluncus curtisii TaxID=2051 RepID=UPI002092E809|nr:hypothetical protein [Mobiluncus curtisii]